ncbi:MAG TPA: hypothetical protein VIH99_02520 [Bdellovibrionota bacterium]|jgi:hypothetical protein
MKVFKLVLFTSLLTLTTPDIANAIQPGMPLLVGQDSVAVAYSVPSESACIILETDGGFDDSDLKGIQSLMSDIDVKAGPGVFETQADGQLPYTYGLVADLKGTKLVYRGLLPSERLTGVKVTSKSGKTLIDLVSQNFARKGRVDFVYSESCGG